MQGISVIVNNAAHQGAFEPQQDAQGGTNPAVKNLFLLLQGSYGSLFLSKYATGVKNDKGHDLGIRATMKVWDSALGKYPADVVESAAARLMTEHREFPPNLPQFVALCEAATPRQSYAQEQGWTALPAPKAEPIKVNLSMQNNGKDWARRILYRVEHGDKSVSKYAHREARIAMKLDGKQAWQ